MVDGATLVEGAAVARDWRPDVPPCTVGAACDADRGRDGTAMGALLPELDPLLLTGAASRRRPPVVVAPVAVAPFAVVPFDAFDTGTVIGFAVDVPPTTPPVPFAQVRSRKLACCCTPIPGS